MKIKKLFLSVFLLTVCVTSCEESDVWNWLTSDENALGLKEALRVGTDTATKTLGATNGYLNDATVKIGLPEQAQTTFKAIDAITSNSLVKAAIDAFDIGITADLKGTLETAFNRAAEEAAPEAADIFVNAITDMSITDATSILFSSDNHAATEYLQTNTSSGLTAAFAPIITTSMEGVKVNVGSNELNTIQAWSYFAEQNNKLADAISNSTVQTAINTASSLGLLSTENKNLINSVQTVDSDLGSYVVGNAINGIFTKIGVQEEKIRTDVSSRTGNALLEKVFGQLEKKEEESN